MVQNPLSSNQHGQMEGLLQRCGDLKGHCKASLIVSIEDVEANLTAYLASDEGVWPEYRQTVPFDYILSEFTGRITAWESTNPSTEFTKAHAVLEKESFNPDFLLDKNAVRFVGNTKKAARLLDKKIEGHNLSVVETDGGGVFVKLGSAFRGKRHIREDDFTETLKKTWATEPALSELLKESIQASHVYAAEGEGEGFEGLPTPPDSERGLGKESDGVDFDEHGRAFPPEFIKLIEDHRHLIPPNPTSETVTEQVIYIDLREPPPPPPPTRLWKHLPPAPAMSRIDSYNIVESGRPTSADGFGWSISGLSEKSQIFQQSQLVTWPEFRIVTGQKAVRRVQTEPSAPEGWMTNELLPQPCSMFRRQFLQRIPSLSADAIVLGYSFNYPSSVAPPEKVRFFKDSADGLYMEIQDFNPAIHTDGSWQVTEAAPPYSQIVDESGLFDCSLTFKDYKGGQGHQYSDYASENEVLEGNGIKDADKVLADQTLTEDSQIGDSIFALWGWLYAPPGWSCENIPRGGGDMIDFYLAENAGACRHRSYIMFLALNRLGLPCRMNGSTSHAWAEIWNPTTGAWVQLNLGGCGDEDPDNCERCERKNPRYGVRRDGVLLKCCPEGYHMEGEVCVPNDGEGDNAEPIDCQKCIPIPCPPDYDCHPALDKCIPDCQTLFGPDHIYIVDRDVCVDCKEEGELMVYDPEINDCNCMDCPEGYSMNKDEYCVNAEGDVSEDAPKGYYFYREASQCLPREDCEKTMPGTVFNEFSLLCECPVITRTNADGEKIKIFQEWDSRLGRCAEKFECDEGQEVVYDPIMGDYKCRDITPDEIKPSELDPDGTRSEPDEEDEDEVGEEGQEIDPDAPMRERLKWLDLSDGTEMIQKEEPPSAADERWKKIGTKKVRLKGRKPTGQRYDERWRWSDLYGIYEWLQTDANPELISYTEPKPDQYHILVSLNDARATEAENEWKLWVGSISSDDGIRGIRMEDLKDDVKPSNLGFPGGRTIALTHAL